MKHKKTSQLLLALLVLGGSFLINEKVYAGTLTITPDMNSTGVSVGDVRVTANISSEVFCVWRNGSLYGDGTGRQVGSGLPQYFGIGEAWTQSIPIASGDYIVRGIAPVDYISCAVLETDFDDYASFTWDGFVASDINSEVTRIDTVSPPNASTTAYTTTLNVTGYINADDYETGTILRLRLVNNTLQNGIGGSALDAWNSAFGGFSIPITSAGAFDLSTTTTFDISGQVNIEWSIQVPNTTWLIGSFLSPQILVSTTTYFIVNQRTGLDIAMASTTDILISALVTGTTTQSVIRCNPANFDITVCLISLLVPPRAVLENDLTSFKNDVLVRFPIGYVTRFLTILGSGATSSLPVFSATIPDALPFGQGQSIELDLNHSLDWILYATTSAFITAEASSTDTLYDITSYYWNIMVYMALGFYIIRRIIGSHIIPKLRHK